MAGTTSSSPRAFLGCPKSTSATRAENNGEVQLASSASIGEELAQRALQQGFCAHFVWRWHSMYWHSMYRHWSDRT